MECSPLLHDGELATELINMKAINNLKQLKSVRNINGRILDLFLTNTSEISLHSIEPLSKFDEHHPPFVINFTASDLKFIKANKTKKYNFFKANYIMINYELSQLKWDNLFTNINLDKMVNKFYEVSYNIINWYTPIIQLKGNKYPKWFTQTIIQLISDKNFYYDNIKQTKLEFFDAMYKMKRRELKYELRANEKRYIFSIENTVETNTKAFFAYTKTLNKTN